LVLSVLQKTVEKLVSLQPDKNNVTLQEDNVHFLSYLAEYFESFRGSQNSHIMFNNFFSKFGAYDENMRKYCTARQSTDDNTVWNIRIVCWTTKATNTHSANVIFAAFAQQEWLHERTSICCLSC
jgi:hypothetical protein